MKKFIVSVLCTAVFFTGLGAIVETAVNAGSRSDERALALIKQARLAIGGDAAINEVRSMIIKGSVSKTVNIEGTQRTEQGETEIALQMPDKLMKKTRIGGPEGAADERVIRQHDVLILKDEAKIAAEGEQGQRRIRVTKIEGDQNGEIAEFGASGRDGEFTTSDGKKVIIRKAEGPNGEVPQRIIIKKDKDGKVIEGADHNVLVKEIAATHEGRRQNELLHLTLGLLMGAPDGMDVAYTYGGESTVDNMPVSLVNAAFGGSEVKIYLSRATSLPVMISYQGHKPMQVFMRTKAPADGEEAKERVAFSRKIAGGPVEMAEFQVRFADYRSVNGIQLPHKWTTSVGGNVDEVLDVASYDLNPANIAEKFQAQKVFVRTKKSDQ